MKPAIVKTVSTVFFLSFCLMLMSNGCADDTPQRTPRSDSGIKKISAEVQVQSNGRTLEQQNIFERYKADSDPAAVKHLYVISSMSGDCIMYSTVKGKVTSSGKRLSPYSVEVHPGGEYAKRHHGYSLADGRITSEVLQDDGTYGSSYPYIYWFDVRGNYHQHYVVGGQIVHVSDVPMAWPKVILNLEELSPSDQ